MSLDQDVSTALVQLIEAAAPARLLLYYRLPNTSGLRHAAITRIENGDCTVEVAGKPLPDALLELVDAHITRTVLVRNAWVSGAARDDLRINDQALILRLQVTQPSELSISNAERPAEQGSGDHAWLATARHHVLEVFERYYGSAAAGQVNALLQMHEKGPNALLFLEAAERALAKVTSPDRARADLAMVRRHLPAHD